jgi:hypothetical protein
LVLLLLLLRGVLPLVRVLLLLLLLLLVLLLLHASWAGTGHQETHVALRLAGRASPSFACLLSLLLASPVLQAARRWWSRLWWTASWLWMYGVFFVLCSLR